MTISQWIRIQIPNNIINGWCNTLFRKYDKETPLPTPTYKKNTWAKGTQRKERAPVDMETYNDEEKRLDREWYGMDEGQDEYHNAFSNISDEYIKVGFLIFLYASEMFYFHIDAFILNFLSSSFLCFFFFNAFP